MLMPDGVCNPVRDVKSHIPELSETLRTGLQTPSGASFYPLSYIRCTRQRCDAFSFPRPIAIVDICRVGRAPRQTFGIYQIQIWLARLERQAIEPGDQRTAMMIEKILKAPHLDEFDELEALKNLDLDDITPADLTKPLNRLKKLGIEIPDNRSQR